MLTHKDQEKIYSVLSKHFSFGIHPMNRLAQTLNDNNLNSKNFGYGKLKSMFAELTDYIRIIDDSTDPTNPQVSFFKWENPSKKIAKKASTPERKLISPTDASNFVCKRDSLPDVLSPNTHMEPKLLALLSAKSNRVVESIPAVIEAAFQQSKADGNIFCGSDRISFPLELLASNGKPIVLTFKRNKKNSSKAFTLQYIDDSGISTPRASANIPDSDNPGQALERFAFLGSWSNFLEELADIALAEDWDFTSSEQKNHYILKKYIQYTFYRLQLENKVAISSDRRLAAFNTGLVDAHYDYIYACFVPNQNGNSPWLFKAFTLAGHSGLGKLMVNRFSPLPQPASYFNRKEDLLYDLNKELHCDYDHILIGNLERFPIEFLRKQFYDAPQALHYLNQIEQKLEKDPYDLNCYEDLRNHLSESLLLYNRIKNRLNDAIHIAEKQVRWNFSFALPSYYPSRNTMNLMLPLQLTCPGVVDNVLVVELTPSGNYQGQTLLTLQQAYIDARLVCYPGNNWLTPQSVKNAHCLDDPSYY